MGGLGGEGSLLFFILAMYAIKLEEKKIKKK